MQLRGPLAILFLAAGALGAAEPTNFKEATKPAEVGPPGKLSGTQERKILAIKEKAAKEWDGIVFEKDGKPVEYVLIFDTDEGPIEIEFFPKLAPNHARSFIALTKAGFYDGVVFHRSIPGFVLQGGCPLGNGYGGPGYNLKAEFSDTKHERGIMSTARKPDDVDSGSSQFFICLADVPKLDNQYTVFGKVTKGMDIVDAIVAKPNRPMSDKPQSPVVIKKATVKIKGQP